MYMIVNIRGWDLEKLEWPVSPLDITSGQLFETSDKEISNRSFRPKSLHEYPLAGHSNRYYRHVIYRHLHLLQPTPTLALSP